MRIQSKFKDFYDYCLKDFQEDPFPVYHRKSETISCNPLLVVDKVSYEIGTFDFLSVIGFAGKLYPLYGRNRYVREFEYDSDEFRVSNLFNGMHSSHKLPTCDGFSQLVQSPILKALFIQHKVPAFMYRFYSDNKDRLILNPRLSDFNFVTALDPYSSIQELSMFLGNDLAHDVQPKMPVGSDKVIDESKGFEKWSFRKPPTK